MNTSKSITLHIRATEILRDVETINRELIFTRSVRDRYSTYDEMWDYHNAHIIGLEATKSKLLYEYSELIVKLIPFEISIAA
jgi:hypothetical protein